MPAPLKEALVRETARRGSNANDVAASILANDFGVPYAPSGRRRKVLAGLLPCFSCAATNGRKNGARAKDKVRVALVGVGSCANSLLKGVEYRTIDCASEPGC